MKIFVLPGYGQESILLQRGMTDLPFVMPPALLGRFLPELGRSFGSGLFSLELVVNAYSAAKLWRGRVRVSSDG